MIKANVYLDMSQSGKSVFLDWIYRNSYENSNQSNSVIFGLNYKYIADLDLVLNESGGLTNYERTFLNIGHINSAIFLSGIQYHGAIYFEYNP